MNIGERTGLMSRRQFLAGSAAATALLPSLRAHALDMDIIESPIMNALRMFPDRPGQDGLGFPITHGWNGRLQRDVYPENPDMYWDPEGEDYRTIFGFHDSWIALGGSQDGVSFWQMNTEPYNGQNTLETLVSNGWEIHDEDLNLMYYAGDDNDRMNLAASLNVLQSPIYEGVWDWISLTNDGSLVIGSDEDLVRAVADRVKNNTPSGAVDKNFHSLRYVLRADTHAMSLLPYQTLPVETATSSFISRAWTGDTPIIQSIGFRLDSANQIEPLIETVKRRLASETSVLNGSPYADFLTVFGTETYRSTLRIDFSDSSDDWDIRIALTSGDLNMLPLVDLDA